MESQSTHIIIYLIIASIAAFGTLLAAIGAFLSAHATKLAAQGQLFTSLLRDYSDEKMLQALNILGTWKDNKRKWTANPDTTFRWTSWADDFKNLRKESESTHARFKEVREVDQARRRVSHYFFTALELHSNKCICKQLFQKICEADGFELLYYIVAELEKLAAESMDKEFKKVQFIDLLNLSGRPAVDKKRLQAQLPKTEKNK